MLDRLTRPIRQSFSAKIILLVVATVLVTSFVVALVATQSTKTFLAAKTCEKFPSVLNSSKAKVRVWYERQLGDLQRLCQSDVFLENLASRVGHPGAVPADSVAPTDLSKYLSIVHEKFPVYEDILVLGKDGDVITYTSDYIVTQAGPVKTILQEEGYSTHYSPAMFLPDNTKVHQWFFVPIVIGEEVEAVMAARTDLEEIGALFREFKTNRGGELFLVDAQGRFLTQPPCATENKLGVKAMQVPTRESGHMTVEKRSNYRGRDVFRGLSRLDETGWWIAYEVDYEHAMEPVINVQMRIWVSVLFIGAIFTLVALKIVQSVVRPIRRLAVGVQRIKEGLVGVNIPMGTDDEIGMTIETFNEMAKTITLSKAELQYKNKMLNSQNDQLQEMNLKLEELSVTDGLTGLFNHRHFWNLLNTELTRANLYRGNLALALIDLDDFKRINDRFGHAVGDLMLQAVAKTLGNTVRDTDIVARYGGEEFAVLLPDTDMKGVENVAEKLRESVGAMRFKVPETDIVVSVTISVGVSVFKGNRREFFNAADRALYLSKSEGKNRVNYAPQA